MAEAEDDITRCPVCFEEYEDQGDHVPRILPCHHTLCEICVKKLLRGNSLTCPQDNIKHEADRGFKTYPQNKYIIAHIFTEKTKRKCLPVEQTQQPTGLCEEHRRPKNIFCLEETCQKLICMRCLRNDHKHHDFEEVDEIRERKNKQLMSELDEFRENLRVNRTKLVTTRSDFQEKFDKLDEELKSHKDNCIRLIIQQHNELRQEAVDTKETIIIDIGDKLAVIDEHLHLIDSMKSNLDGNLEEVDSKLQIISDVVLLVHDTLGGNKTFNYCQFSKGELIQETVRKLLGYLTPNVHSVNLSLVNPECTGAFLLSAFVV